MYSIFTAYGGSYLKCYCLLELVFVEKYDEIIFIKTTTATIPIINLSNDILDGDKYISDIYNIYLLLLVSIIVIIVGNVIYIIIKREKINL